MIGALCSVSVASAARTHVFREAFGSVAQPAFSQPEGLAVDQSTGDLLVIDAGTGTVSRYHADGSPANFSALGSNVIDGLGAGDQTPQGGLSFGGAKEVQVAVDNSGAITDGNIYVTQGGAHLIDIFGADGGYLGQLTAAGAIGFGEACGVGVDAGGAVYVGDFDGQVHKFAPSANPPSNSDNTANFASESPCTLAAGAGSSAGSLFVDGYVSTDLNKLDSVSGETQYKVSSGATTVTVDPASGHVYAAVGGAVNEFDASGPDEAAPASSFTPGGEVRGVAVSASSGNVYVARSGAAQIQVYGPAVTLPDATTEAATAVGSASATLHGTVNADGGPPATCVFQYVEIQADGFAGATSVPCSPAGPFTGTAVSAVRAEIAGLGEARYRFRLLANNADGTTEGKALFFSTERAFGLPDGRAYEMVSPAVKQGEVFSPEARGSLDGSCDECLPGVDSAKMPMQSSPSGDAVVFEGQPFSGGHAAGPNEYLAARTPGGWAADSLSAPQFVTFSAFPGQTQGFLSFSSDLSVGVLSQVTPSLAPGAPTDYANLYLWREGAALQPVITQAPPHRLPGFVGEIGQNRFRVVFAGANAGTASSAASSHLAFEANDALTGPTPSAPAAPEVEATQNNVYEWVGGELRLVNVLPGNGGASAGAVIGSGRLLNPGKTSEAPQFDHAISADGRRIFWTDEASGQVYLRIDGQETRAIPDSGSFLTASTDGSKVLLNDGHIFDHLDGGAPSETDLTEGQGGFQGILGATDDLSRVYFVDTAALTPPGEENANHEHAEAGADNLYLRDGASASFIAALLPKDNELAVNQSDGAWKGPAANRTAQVSADGNYLAFMSYAGLTGYDNTRRDGSSCLNDLLSSPICAQVFEYDADAGDLLCASCNPTGERPLGQSNLSLFGPAANGLPQPSNLSAEGNGRLFFESLDALSPRDTNGRIQDVYEWEPDGVGDCRRPEGCVSLISTGHDGNDSLFMDATPSGDDVFITTRERLLPQDQDELIDLYDARVGGGIAGAEGIAPCGAEGCRGPLSGSPRLPGAGSAEFSGPGNRSVHACRAGFIKRHGKCVKKKHHKKSKKHQKKPGAHKRGGAK